MPVFKTFLSIELFHDYYMDSKSRDIRLFPTNDTRLLLNNQGMIFRGSGHSVILAAEVEETASETYTLKRELPEKARFTFLMQLLNADFFNYSDLAPFTSDKNNYYFNNRQENIEGDLLYLHRKKDAANRVSDLNHATLRTGMFNYTFSGTGDSKTARLSAIDASFTTSQVVYAQEGDYHLQFDLSEVPSGRYQLLIDDTVEQEFYALNQRLGVRTFGVIEIFHFSEIPATYRLLNTDGTLKAPVFSIGFGNRSTHWRYLVVNNSNASLDDPGIQASGFTFAEQPAGDFPPNYKVFVSDQAIPLSEEGISGISLRKKFSSANRPVLETLPNPGQRIIKPDETDSSKYYSEIYVYL